MPLQFQPPPDWLMQNYMNRKSPVEEILGAGEAISKNYSDYKALEKKDQNSALDSVIAAYNAGGPEFASEVAKHRGLKNPPQLPGMSSGTIPSPQVQPPVAGQQALGDPETRENVANRPRPGATDEQALFPQSPVVQASLAHEPHAKALGYQPPTPEQMAAYRTQGAWGGKQITEARQTQEMDKGSLEIQKLQKELDGKGPLETLTKEKALANGSFDPATQLMVEPPAPRLDLSEKENQFYQKEWDKIVKDTNPLTASSRSTLGMASKADFQANRALVTLSKPVVTNQEAGNVMADIAAIYQTGSPTQYGMSHQEYSTLYGKLEGVRQTVTGKPTDSLPTAIKERLLEVLHDMKQTNNSVLKQQLDYTEKSKARIIKKFPDEWKDIRTTFESGMSPQSAGVPIPAAGPHGKSITQNGQTYNWNTQTGNYE